MHVLAGALPTAFARATTGPGGERCEPFHSVEQAWFWTMAALVARREGSRNSGVRVARPCDPDDVVKCLDQLYRRRRIDLVHARILRIWGERGVAPNPAYRARALRLADLARGPLPAGMAAAGQGHRGIIDCKK